MTGRDFDSSGITPELLARYDRPGPRYTSYPTAPQFHEGFDEAAYRDRLADGRAAGRTSRCPCTSTSRSARRAAPTAAATWSSRPTAVPRRRTSRPSSASSTCSPRRSATAARLNQLHWGGGTPTYLTPEQCERLFTRHHRPLPARRRAPRWPSRSTPASPRSSTSRTLRRLGFNRLSMGVQDLDPEVQEAVAPRAAARADPRPRRRGATARLRLGQRRPDLRPAAPDRGELPRHRANRHRRARARPRGLLLLRPRAVDQAPPAAARHRCHGRAASTSCGCSSARPRSSLRPATASSASTTSPGPTDELARALDDGRLHRNFMGYTVMPASDQIGVGVTSIGDVGRRLRRQPEEPRPLPARGRRGPAAGRARHRPHRRGRAPRRGDPPHHLHARASTSPTSSARSASTSARPLRRRPRRARAHGRRRSGRARRRRPAGHPPRPLLPAQRLHALRRLPRPAPDRPLYSRTV